MKAIFTGHLSRLALLVSAPFALIALAVLAFGGPGQWVAILGFAALSAVLFAGIRVLGYVDSEIARRKRARGARER